jgi:hypothetical protein
MHEGMWCGNLEERDLLEDLGAERRIILKCFFRK